MTEIDVTNPLTPKNIKINPKETGYPGHFYLNRKVYNIEDKPPFIRLSVKFWNVYKLKED